MILSRLAQIVDCEHKTAPIDMNGEYFAVGTPAMKGNIINYDESRRISADTFAAWTRRLTPKQGDLLLAREAPVGPVVRIPEALNVAPGQRTVLIRPTYFDLDPRFLYYKLISPQVQAPMQTMAAGSTVPHLNVEDVRALELGDLPDLSRQQAIAEVLGALDDKIAANRLAIRGSLELVDALYAQTPKLDRKSTFGQVAELGGGGTPSTQVDQYWGGGLPWATPSDVTKLNGSWLLTTERTITEEGLEKSTSKLYPENSVLMTSRASLGYCAMAPVPTAVNQGFIVVNARDKKLQPWFFAQLRARKREWESWANGATFLELSRGVFRNLSADLGTAEDMAAFTSAATPLLERSRAVEKENITLARTRDELLPLLMSGRITVKDAEKRVSEEV